MTTPLDVHVINDAKSLVDYLNDIWPTFLGAVLGFAFAWLLARLEAKSARSRDLAEGEQRNLECVREALYVSAANIEALLSAKNRLILPLKRDTDALRTAVASGDLSKIVIANNSIDNYFQIIPSPPTLPLPARDRWMFAMMDLPYFVLTMLRHDGALEELATIIEKRNGLVGQIGAEPDIEIASRRWRYFTDMMNSAADATLELINDSLFFSDFTNRQLLAYARWRFPGEELPVHELGDKAKPLMPNSDAYKLFEAQYVGKWSRQPNKARPWWHRFNHR